MYLNVVFVNFLLTWSKYLPNKPWQIVAVLSLDCSCLGRLHSLSLLSRKRMCQESSQGQVKSVSSLQ